MVEVGPSLMILGRRELFYLPVLAAGRYKKDNFHYPIQTGSQHLWL